MLSSKSEDLKVKAFPAPENVMMTISQPNNLLSSWAFFNRPCCLFENVTIRSCLSCTKSISLSLSHLSLLAPKISLLLNVDEEKTKTKNKTETSLVVVDELRSLCFFRKMKKTKERARYSKLMYSNGFIRGRTTATQQDMPTWLRT